MATLTSLYCPTHMTLAELSRYNGVDADLPVLVSLDRRIYDISAEAGNARLAPFFGQEALTGLLAAGFDDVVRLPGGFDSTHNDNPLGGEKSLTQVRSKNLIHHFDHHYRIYGWLMDPPPAS